MTKAQLKPNKTVKQYYINDIKMDDELRHRRTIHSQQIRDPSTKQIHLSEHFDKCGMKNLKFELFPFYK